jgi:cytochrome c553
MVGSRGRYNQKVDLILFISHLDCLAQNEQVVVHDVCPGCRFGDGFHQPMAQEVKGDAKAGAGKIAMCIGCHGIKGYQASFPEIYKVPMISGQGAKYISSRWPPTRRASASTPPCAALPSLSEQDIADVAAYYEASGKEGATAPRKAPTPQRQGGRAGQEGRLRVLPRRQLQQADRPDLPQDRRPACRLPVRRAQVLQDRRQRHLGPQQRRDGGIAKQFSNAELKAWPTTWPRCPRPARPFRRPSSADQLPFAAPRSVRRVALRGFSQSRGVALHAGDVGVAVRRAAGPLALPDHPAQALHGAMVGRRAASCAGASAVPRPGGCRAAGRSSTAR